MRQSKIIMLLFSALVFNLAGCLKERDRNINPDKGARNVIEFENTGDNVAGASSTYPRFAIDLGSVTVGKSVDFNINVSYSGADVAPQDITVNIELDPTALDKFNKENGTDYKVPSADIYKIPTSAVIAKGTRMAQVKTTITRTANFDFGVNYALPLKITSPSTGTISSNFGKAIYSFSLRNQYDGVYTMTGTMTDITSSSLTGLYPLDMSLITYTGNSVALYDGKGYYSKGYYHPIASGSSVSAYGSFSPIFYFDDNGNITKVENIYGQPASNGRSGKLDPTGINKISFNSNGSVKQFEVSYIMIQAGAPRTYFNEKFVFKNGR